jgi:hypothetical protein
MQNDEKPKAELSEGRHGYHLIPFAILAGVAPRPEDDRLIRAQSALNRVQVWIGDLFIDFRLWRKRRQSGAGSMDLRVDREARVD